MQGKLHYTTGKNSLRLGADSIVVEMADMKGHKYGNFHEYYTFHQQESRTTLIPKNFFLSLWKSQGEPATFTLLDIGCNEGNLTIELLSRAVSELPSEVHCFALGVDLDDVLIQRANEKSVNTPNISFLTVDIMSRDDGDGVSLINNFCRSKNFQGFSFVSQFSITMWIHLNHGDIGLEIFLSLGAGLLSDVSNYKSVICRICVTVLTSANKHQF